MPLSKSTEHLLSQSTEHLLSKSTEHLPDEKSLLKECQHKECQYELTGKQIINVAFLFACWYIATTRRDKLKFRFNEMKIKLSVIKSSEESCPVIDRILVLSKLMPKEEVKEKVKNKKSNPVERESAKIYKIKRNSFLEEIYKQINSNTLLINATNVLFDNINNQFSSQKQSNILLSNKTKKKIAALRDNHPFAIDDKEFLQSPSNPKESPLDNMHNIFDKELLPKLQHFSVLDDDEKKHKLSDILAKTATPAQKSEIVAEGAVGFDPEAGRY